MAAKKKTKKKKKPKMARDWNAVAAHFRNSAGSMKDKKKSNNKNDCRKFKQKKSEE